MLLPLLLAATLAGPGPTDEGVVYEEPREVVEPITISVAEPAPVPEAPAPEVAPAPAPEAPAQVIEQPAIVLPPPPPPPTGAGRLVGGSFAVGLGVAAAGAVLVESVREGGNPRFVAATFIPLGLTGIGLGTYLLVRGGKARQNFNDWRAYTSSEARPTGEGLVVAGTMSLVIGGVTLVAGGVQAREPGAFERPLAPSLFAIGATGLAVGVGTLTWGLMRRGHYRRWRQRTFLSHVRPTITPLAQPGLGGSWQVHGASFGLVGAL